jgi:hypothetical protein
MRDRRPWSDRGQLKTLRPTAVSPNGDFDLLDTKQPLPLRLIPEAVSRALRILLGEVHVDRLAVAGLDERRQSHAQRLLRHGSQVGVALRAKGLRVRAALLPERDELRVQRRLLVSAIETAKRANNRERSLYWFPASQTASALLRVLVLRALG